MKLADGSHLTYCSNIHPGETAEEVFANLRRFVPAVRDRIAPGRRFGIGLRLSAQAVDAFSQPARLAELKQFLAAGDLYVFTLNAFPYGPFHGRRVKEDVYLPDWRDPERLRYTDAAASLLAALLPADAHLAGSVSTVPGAFKPLVRTDDDVDAMVANLVRHAAHLVALERRTGRRIALALEPEPCCFLETIDESVDFFTRHVYGAHAVRRMQDACGLDAADADAALRRHIGLCLDLCHAAVEFEDPRAGLAKLAGAGIAIPKLQVSAGLRLPVLDEASLSALRAYEDAVYLHQVVSRGTDGLTRFVDLPDAFASLGTTRAGEEWRVHFHVPVFHDRLGPFRSTRDFIEAVLALHRERPVSRHLEVETYTWDVLPPALRATSVDEAVARELAWVAGVIEA